MSESPIYLIVCKSKYSKVENVISFNDKEKAISCASAIATNGHFSNYEDYIVREAKLTNVIEFNLSTLRGSSHDLVLDDGRFTFKKKSTKK